MTRPINPSRRDFIRHTTAVGAGVVTAELTSKTRAQTPSANERIGIGIIGCGGIAGHHMEILKMFGKMGRVDIVAVCDVFSKRLDAAAAKTGAKPYKLWSDLLADKRVDAVLIATPEHWHAPLTIAAAEAGKDIYCEKPMCHYDHLDLAKKVVETVANKQRVMQVGTQLLSDEMWKLAKEKLASLGKIVYVQAVDCRNGQLGYAAPPDVADGVPGKTLDWDMWQGCEMTRVPKRPYSRQRFLLFRAFWDYSGGIITDQFPHALTPGVDLMDLGFPKRVVTVGGLYFWKDGREVPDTVTSSIEYEEGPAVSVFGSLATAQDKPKMLIRGQKAAMVFTGTNEPVQIIPEEAAGGGKPTELRGKKAMPLAEHWQDFLSCIKTRKKPISNEILGYRVMVALSMATKSYRSGKVLGFDPQNGTVTGL